MVVVESDNLGMTKLSRCKYIALNSLVQPIHLNKVYMNEKNAQK